VGQLSLREKGGEKNHRRVGRGRRVSSSRLVEQDRRPSKKSNGEGVPLKLLFGAAGKRKLYSDRRRGPSGRKRNGRVNTEEDEKDRYSDGRRDSPTVTQSQKDLWKKGALRVLQTRQMVEKSNEGGFCSVDGRDLTPGSPRNREAQLFSTVI